MAERDDDMLDDLFRAARAAAPVPSEALMARILDDARAGAVTPRPAAAAAVPGPRRWRFAAMMGGWRGIGGLVTATAAGLWIGYGGYAGAVGFASELADETETAATVELMPGLDGFVLALGEEG